VRVRQRRFLPETPDEVQYQAPTPFLAPIVRPVT
jgi:hypothetical protein